MKIEPLVKVYTINPTQAVLEADNKRYAGG